MSHRSALLVTVGGSRFAPPLASAGAFGHPSLKGEGRIAAGDPGRGDSGAVHDSDAACAEALSPPPGPLAQADPPPPGGGGLAGTSSSTSSISAHEKPVTSASNCRSASARSSTASAPGSQPALRASLLSASA